MDGSSQIAFTHAFDNQMVDNNKKMNCGPNIRSNQQHQPEKKHRKQWLRRLGHRIMCSQPQRAACSSPKITQHNRMANSMYTNFRGIRPQKRRTNWHGPRTQSAVEGLRRAFRQSARVWSAAGILSASVA